MRRFSVLGVPVDLAYADPRVEKLVAECLLPHRAEQELPALRLHIEAADAADSAWPSAPGFQVSGTYLEIGTPFGNGHADQASGQAFARVIARPDTVATVQDTITETLSLFMAYAHRPIVLHAAAVEADGVCALLTGPQGSGKSTLTYACVRSGMRLVAEDVVYFTDERTRVAWGHPAAVHLLPDARSLFPDLEGAAVVQRLNGEEKLRVPVLARMPRATQPCHRVDGVAVLSRGTDARPCLKPASGVEVANTLTSWQGAPPQGQTKLQAKANLLSELPSARLISGEVGATVAALREWMSAL